MGYRTVVILDNDTQTGWVQASGLGNQISAAAHNLMRAKNGNFAYGNVVQVCHADTQSLAMIDSFGVKFLAQTLCHNPQNDAALNLLKDAAANLGYKLVKA